jgi:hypothetical protein
MSISKEVPEFAEELSQYNILFFCVFGSRLYGTDTADSDRDYKGIYVPTLRDYLFDRAQKSIHFKTKKGSDEKNGSSDVDIELLSLPYFIKLLLDGETMTIDMLHAPEDKILVTSPIWEYIQSKRTQFYTKNLDAFARYARKQAAKYGIKGSRLHAMKQYLEFIQTCGGKSARPLEGRCDLNKILSSIKLKDVWDELPRIEHVHFYDADPDNGVPWRMVEVCDQKFQETVKLSYMRDAIQKKYDEYGVRARLAQENEGVDWKAVSHALRACAQLREIYTTGDLNYPIKIASFLRDIKLEKWDYKDVAEILEAAIQDVEKLAMKSTYPEAPNVELWKDLVYYWCAAILCKNIVDTDNLIV